ncbi:MAG TPA: hypothetical protein VHE55_15200 [Fimbriimonadaceae bacterium]|nr:hypothetical protein [Fimbriimonadaceae bacterium]
MKRAAYAIGFAFAASSAFAVVGVNTGPGSSDSTYLWVGQCSGASCVAISSHWAITAHHVGGSSVLINGVTYNADRTYGDPHGDIWLMHFPTAFPGYYPLYSGNPLGKTVTLVGFGDTGSLRGDGLGYNDLGFGGTRRTATNVVGLKQVLSYNGWDTPEIIADLDPPVGNSFSSPYNRDWFGDGGATPDEGSLMAGDSGGAWLINDGGKIYIAGVSNYVVNDDGFSDPNPLWAFGISGCSAADLTAPVVRQWINNTMLGSPLPSPTVHH